MAKTKTMDRKHVTILNTRIDSTNKDALLSIVASSLKKKRKIFITTPNPEILVEASQNKKLSEALSASDVSLPDGVGIKYMASLFYKTKVNTYPGRLAFLDLLAYANKNSLKVFLLGGEKDVLEKCLSKIKREYPNIIVKGNTGQILDKNAEPVSEKDKKIDKDIVGRINLFLPDLLFVALGAPKQELWIYKNWDRLKIGGVAMVIGGTLNYYAGKSKVPPKIVSTLGFEWLWRLVWEPRRLKRIFRAIIIFPVEVLKEKVFRTNL